MSVFNNTDPKTVAYDWAEHLKRCHACCSIEALIQAGQSPVGADASVRAEHYERVKELAEKYPLSCAACGKDLEDSPFLRWCYHVDEKTGVMCRSTKFYFRAHQPRPTT